MNDEQANLLALVDQMSEAVKVLTVPLGVYFKALMRQGFKRDEAMSLTQEYQERLFDAAGLGNRREEA